MTENTEITKYAHQQCLQHLMIDVFTKAGNSATIKYLSIVIETIFTNIDLRMTRNI